MSNQLALPLGVRIVDALCEMPIEDVRKSMPESGVSDALFVIEQALTGTFRAGFMHSAVCAMSLPVRRPKDDTLPIVRRDGVYSLVITPRKRMEPIGPDGEMIEVCKGVPFGPLARVVLFYIMTEAVRSRSRQVFLGSNFSDWMRRMGIQATRSGGERSSRRLVQEQIERLMNCEWTFRYDGPKSKRRNASGKMEMLGTVAVNDLRLTTGYAGLQGPEGGFVGAFALSEEFYSTLIEHSVPLVENAVKALKSSAMALDLYAWLAYRLPRVAEGQEVRVSWADLAKHFGSGAGSLGKFRQSIRDVWNDVACAYPQARHSADFSGLSIRLRYADAPTKGQLVLCKSGMIEALEPVSRGEVRSKPTRKTQLLQADLLDFPSAPLRWGVREEKFRAIGLEYGKPWDVDLIHQEFVKGFRGISQQRSDDEWQRIWKDFCTSYADRRRRG